MSTLKLINLVNLPRTVSTPLTFPLTSENLSQIESLKLAFRNSFQQHQVYSLGMAAPQISVFKRFFIMPKDFRYGQITDFSKLHRLVRNFNVYINPEITWKSQEVKSMREYCLSVGTNQYKVTRPKQIKVLYWDQKGQQHSQRLDDLRARVFQHEYDHLEGLLMTDHPTAKIVADNSSRNIAK